MTKHTPGPWAITTAPYGALRVGPALLEHPGREAVEYAQARGRDLLAQRAADAALIAAAPDMLAALRAMVAFVATDGHALSMIPEDTWNTARHVINQATGDAA